MKNKIMCPKDIKLKDYLIAVNAVKKVTPHKLDDLYKKYSRSADENKREKMRQEIIEQNLKQVISIAAGYRGAGITFCALIEAGNRALIDCVIKLKADDAAEVSPLITWCVEGGIIDAIISAKKSSDKNGRV
jgi:RNA polymerase primary sigma factor